MTWPFDRKQRPYHVGHTYKWKMGAKGLCTRLRKDNAWMYICRYTYIHIHTYIRMCLCRMYARVKLQIHKHDLSRCLLTYRCRDTCSGISHTNTSCILWVPSCILRYTFIHTHTHTYSMCTGHSIKIPRSWLLHKNINKQMYILVHETQSKCHPGSAKYRSYHGEHFLPLYWLEQPLKQYTKWFVPSQKPSKQSSWSMHGSDDFVSLALYLLL